MGGCLLGLQKKLLVEGLVLVAPFVSTAPTGVASVSNATVTSTGFKSEVQQVVQAYFFRSCQLSRAELGPARLCYLETRGSIAFDQMHVNKQLLKFSHH